MKRSYTPERAVSPPIVKRKIESTTTNKAVASFFTPVSRKKPEKLLWRIIDHSLIIGQYDYSGKRLQALKPPVRIASFDLDDTIIAPTQHRFVKSASSWKWRDSCVPGRLKSLYEEGYLVVILSNQGNISLKEPSKTSRKDSLSLQNFKDQIASICRQLDFPLSIYAATGQDRFRKPRVGMWREMLEDHDLHSSGAIDMTNSFYVGDAAGREKTDKHPKDHASSDRNLAANIGIQFHTPEEFFLASEKEPFKLSFAPKDFLSTSGVINLPSETKNRFTKNNPQELVVFCGSPGAGKSTFYWEVLQPLGYERVNQDILKTRDRCIKTAKDFLMAGLSVAVDNTNADIATRAHWIQVAREFKVPIRCVYFTASTRLAEHNDSVRALNPKLMNPENRTMLPGIAFRSFNQRFIQPTLAERFQDITPVDFEFTGNEEQREVWSAHWVSRFST